MTASTWQHAVISRSACTNDTINPMNRQHARARPSHPQIAYGAITLISFLLAVGARADTRDPAKPYTQKIPDSDVTFDMKPIPAGKFLMGSPAGEAHRN